MRAFLVIFAIRKNLLNKNFVHLLHHSIEAIPEYLIDSTESSSLSKSIILEVFSLDGERARDLISHEL